MACTVVETNPHYGNVRRMTTSDTGRCLALAGTVGDAVTCTVYENRPAPCREFENGSSPCRRARLSAGIR
jgi:Fe-S-cluster containining protein